MPRNLKNQWRFNTSWREPGSDGRLRDYAQSFSFEDGNSAARAHHGARRGGWMLEGWCDGWVSELRKYEVDMDDPVHRARIVAVEQGPADLVLRERSAA